MRNAERKAVSWAETGGEKGERWYSSGEIERVSAADGTRLLAACRTTYRKRRGATSRGARRRPLRGLRAAWRRRNERHR